MSSELNNPVLFRVFDTKSQTYWVSPKGKHVWSASAYAKNAWNCACSWGGRGKFDDQPNLEVHKFRLIQEIDIHEGENETAG